MCISILALSGCCKDKRNDIPGKQCDPRPNEISHFWLGEAKDYMYFKPGTWWVYKNTNTGMIDTIQVYSSSLDTFTVKGREDYSYHRIFIYESAVVRLKARNIM